MWMLLVDIVTAGPLGPNPRLFAAGVAVFLAGWGLTRVVQAVVNRLRRSLTRFLTFSGSLH